MATTVVATLTDETMAKFLRLKAALRERGERANANLVVERLVRMADAEAFVEFGREAVATRDA